MKKCATKKMTMLALASTIMLTACGTNPHTGQGTFTKGDAGAVIGAVTGALLAGQVGEGGGKTAAAVVGGLVGAWAGRKVGDSMTASDQYHLERASTTATSAPIGETIEWYNPETGHQGAITPTREGQTSSGRYCREYQQEVTIGGQTEQTYGQACRQPDGSWEIVN